jgi:ABC-type antimicrobial peptide transport system permease subunit
VVALVLAAIGLYAVMAMYVRQRDRDIAVRKAIGATAGHIRELVVREALWLSIVGAAIGLAGAAGATRLVRGLLYDVSPLDPLSLCGAAVLLVGLSIAASYIPVRRALRVDPIIALRYD